ncbi:nitroreductase family deazaflavin-dependent oxidoreductase [Sphaerobacter thermophilus]|uniref:nitroreductase family deazaflavin-dependent oxidoreductase n=1 Tax=Sphaerobacter thermophilus TaxID=2057 RepID=UPI000DB41C0B|nr:MAG: nitroreductase family deazaflavin-dependent oxidoreductase [Sphaerobacter thermophilus]
MVAQTYRMTLGRRLANAFVRAMLAVGVPIRDTYVLTVRGRRTGRPHSTPVRLVEENGNRWLVAPYGPVNWVRNARAAGQVTLSRGRKLETVAIEELGPTESAPVLKRYLEEVPIVRPFFDVTPDSSLEAFAAEAPRHPVFRIVGPVWENHSRGASL